VLAAIATPFVIVAVAILLFLNPVWFSFDQDRSGVDRLTGFTSAEVHAATNAILSDLVFGPPTFDMQVNGRAVLDPRERSHMADVATVFHQLGIVALAALVVLVAVALWSRGRWWFWRAVGAAAAAVVVAVVVVGVAFGLFFDQTFTLLHELFFPAGSWTFDPGSERLVQLFPEQLWTETVMAVVVAVLVLSVAVVVVARHNASRVGPERLLA
jgi:integral membrane protein (TIGR01906 family)